MPPTKGALLDLFAYSDSLSGDFLAADSNGEVEGPRDGTRLEPRADNLPQRPRRHYRASRPPPTIVRCRHQPDLSGSIASPFVLDSIALKSATITAISPRVIASASSSQVAKKYKENFSRVSALVEMTLMSSRNI